MELLYDENIVLKSLGITTWHKKLNPHDKKPECITNFVDMLQGPGEMDVSVTRSLQEASGIDGNVQVSCKFTSSISMTEFTSFWCLRDMQQDMHGRRRENGVKSNFLVINDETEKFVLALKTEHKADRYDLYKHYALIGPGSLNQNGRTDPAVSWLVDAQTKSIEIVEIGSSMQKHGRCT